MEAIQIYEKVLKIVKDEDYSEASLALSFVSRKIENDYYKKQNQGLGVGILHPVACSSKFSQPVAQTESDANSVPENSEAIPEPLNGE